MPDRKTTTENGSEKPRPDDQVRLKPAGEALVKTQDDPVEPPPDKQIHPRRPLRLVPEGPTRSETE
jgi:hypothetical protein